MLRYLALLINPPYKPSRTIDERHFAVHTMRRFLIMLYHVERKTWYPIGAANDPATGETQRSHMWDNASVAITSLERTYKWSKHTFGFTRESEYQEMLDGLRRGEASPSDGTWRWAIVPVDIPLDLPIAGAFTDNR